MESGVSWHRRPVPFHPRPTAAPPRPCSSLNPIVPVTRPLSASPRTPHLRADPGTEKSGRMTVAFLMEWGPERPPRRRPGCPSCTSDSGMHPPAQRVPRRGAGRAGEGNAASVAILAVDTRPVPPWHQPGRTF